EDSDVKLPALLCELAQDRKICNHVAAPVLREHDHVNGTWQLAERGEVGRADGNAAFVLLEAVAVAGHLFLERLVGETLGEAGTVDRHGRLPSAADGYISQNTPAAPVLPLIAAAAHSRSFSSRGGHVPARLGPLGRALLLLGLALRGARLIHRRGRDALGGVLGPPPFLEVALDVVVLTLALVSPGFLRHGSTSTATGVQAPCALRRQGAQAARHAARRCG